MGQYFNPCILGKDKKIVEKWVYSHDIKTKYTREDGTFFFSGSGLKLMEHSWLDNPFVKRFETLIANNPQSVVWAGDFAPQELMQVADIELTTEMVKFIQENVSIINRNREGKCNFNFSKDLILHDDREMMLDAINSKILSAFKEGDRIDTGTEENTGLQIQNNCLKVFLIDNIYGNCNDDTKVKPAKSISAKHRFVVNHSKKQFVDKKAIPDKDGWTIHPLPLLTSEGNGNGGGDFNGKDTKNIVGSWARDLISIETGIPQGYTQLIFDLVE